MGTMIPGVRPCASEWVSQAERDVLDALANFPGDWHLIHSLWLKTHKVKLHAEVDFVLIWERAVLLLEVKGGDVWRDDEGWHFRSKSGHGENVKKEGPFDQARGAYYALREHLQNCERDDLFDDFIWGYGVICPDCVLNISQRDAFVDPCMLLDERGFPHHLAVYLSALVDYWAARYERGDIAGVKRGKTRQRSVSPGKRLEIVSLLRPKFDLVVGPGASSAHAEKDLITLTETQLGALDYMSLESRNLVVGAAGTGKTVLVVEQARRQAAEGKKVLLICFNKLLAKKIAFSFSSESGGTIDVWNYHQLVISLCQKKGMRRTVAETWDEFCKSLREVSTEIIASLEPDDLYDYLVMDEGQDLMNDEFMGFADCLLKGGLREGNWMIACDMQQAIFRGNFNQPLLERFSAWAKKTPLIVNCRNTRQIAAYVTGLSGVGSSITRGVDGELPVIRYFENREQYLRILKKVVNELIQSFLEAGLPLGEIVILYAASEYVPAEVMKPGFFLRVANTIEEPDFARRSGIQVCSVQGFKGLEARAVVLVGIGDLSTTMWRDLYYVGASRAKTNLRVLLPTSCEQVKSTLPEIMRLLSAEPAKR